jgi:ABC-type nickel/cobalt efflux system permease component RcnA
MIEPRSTQGGLRPGHKLTVVAAAVVAAIVVYLAFGWIVGLVAFLIKTAVVIVVIGGVLYLVLRRSRRRL